MTTANPFLDTLPLDEYSEQSGDGETGLTLVVEGCVSLTIREESLVILGQSSSKNRACNSLLNRWFSDTSNTRVLPLYNLLWANICNYNLVIYYAIPTSKTVVRPAILKYPIESHEIELGKKWLSTLLDRSYGSSQKLKRIKVLVNPCSGKGGAVKTFIRDVEPLLKAANCTIDIVKTSYRGEAVELLEKIDIESFDVVASCSGDGLPHEVFNGLGKRPDARRALSKIAVVQIPCGSGNAMSCNLNGSDSVSLATLAIIKGIATPFDLMSITQAGRRTLSFLSQSVGIVAESDLATEHLRFLGAQRFTYGILTCLLRKTIYPCDIAIKVALDDKQMIKEHYWNEKTKRYNVSKYFSDDTSLNMRNQDGLPHLKYGTINDDLPEDWELIPYDNLGNFYCGNMAYMASGANFFSATIPNDGFMDLICINGDIGRCKGLKMLSAVKDGNTIFFNMPTVWYRKILAYRLIPRNQKDGYISIDGERIPFLPFQVEVHRGLGTVLSKNGYSYEAPGLSECS